MRSSLGRVNKIIRAFRLSQERRKKLEEFLEEAAKLVIDLVCEEIPRAIERGQADVKIRICDVHDLSAFLLPVEKIVPSLLGRMEWLEPLNAKVCKILGEVYAEPQGVWVKCGPENYFQINF